MKLSPLTEPKPTSLPGQPLSYRGLTPIRNQLSQSISSFFGYKVKGLFQTAEEVKNAPAQDGAGVGRFRYEDLNGDGKINDADRTYLGSPVLNLPQVLPFV